VQTTTQPPRIIVIVIPPFPAHKQTKNYGPPPPPTTKHHSHPTTKEKVNHLAKTHWPSVVAPPAQKIESHKMREEDVRGTLISE
jgi:hypothetical protein